MLKDTVRPNGTIKRVQYVKAPRGGTSSMGKRFKKGEAILHLSSSRSTGEVFVLLPDEIMKTLQIEAEFGYECGPCAKPGKWARPTDWSKHLTERWEAAYLKAYGHSFKDQSKCERCCRGGDYHPGAREQMKELLQKRI